MARAPEASDVDDCGDDLSGILVGRYRLIRVIGEGGMGLVYDAEQIDTRKKFAVKVLSDEFCNQTTHVERFMREARATARIDHPNIVEIGDVGPTPNGSVFFAMELLEGEDLGVMLAREGPQPWSRVRHIMLQLCTALDAAHSRGVVHRDIKPNNCFRTSRGGDPDFIKVLDFGIAKLLGEEHATGKKLTRTGQIFGTPEYMSPEQVRGLPADPRMDLYSVGIILFELLTGRTPFEGDAPLEILAKHLRDPIPSAASGRGALHMPRELDAIVQRALAKDVGERFQSAAEFRDALERIGATERVQVLTQNEEELFRPRLGQGRQATPHLVHRVALAAAVLMLVTAVAIAILAFPPGADGPTDPKDGAASAAPAPELARSAAKNHGPTPAPRDSVQRQEVPPLQSPLAPAPGAASASSAVAESAPTQPSPEDTEARSDPAAANGEIALTKKDVKAALKRANVARCTLRDRGWRADETVTVTLKVAARTGRVRSATAKHSGGIKKIADCVAAAVLEDATFPPGRAASTETHTFRKP